MSGGRAVKRVASSLLVIGSLLLAFVAYQLWGTALYEHSAQSRLRQELKGTLHTTGTLPSAIRATTPKSSSLELTHTAPPGPDPATGATVGLLTIPAIGMQNAAIVEGTGEDQLKEGPGHYAGTPLPGQAGNAAIAGHRTTYGAPFYRLDSLKAGDAIDVETSQGLFRYSVVKSTVVSPDDTGVLQPTALPELTLTTCNPRYSASSRLVVQALLSASVTNSSFTGTTTPSSPGSQPPAGRPPASLAGEGPRVPLAGSDVAGGVTFAALWGAGVVLAALAVRLVWRRARGQTRWLAALGVLAGLACLLMCFGAVSQAVPASF